MNYGQIRQYDVANGLGIRTTVFVTGCSFKCKGCFNEEYQNFDYGNTWTNNTTIKLKNMLNNPNIDGLSILGGEPFEHTEEICNIIDNLKTSKNIWIWSGYVFEDIVKCADKLELLKRVNILVDGQFIEDEKDLKLKFRGSSNQRIINVKKSLDLNKVIIENF